MYCIYENFVMKKTSICLIIVYKVNIVCLQNESKYRTTDKVFTQLMITAVIMFCYGFLYYVVTCNQL